MLYCLGLLLEVNMKNTFIVIVIMVEIVILTVVKYFNSHFKL